MHTLSGIASDEHWHKQKQKIAKTVPKKWLDYLINELAKSRRSIAKKIYEGYEKAAEKAVEAIKKSKDANELYKAIKTLEVIANKIGLISPEELELQLQQKERAEAETALAKSKTINENAETGRIELIIK